MYTTNPKASTKVIFFKDLWIVSQEEIQWNHKNSIKVEKKIELKETNRTNRKQIARIQILC